VQHFASLKPGRTAPSSAVTGHSFWTRTACACRHVVAAQGGWLCLPCAPRRFLVPTLCVGMHIPTLCVESFCVSTMDTPPFPTQSPGAPGRFPTQSVGTRRTFPACNRNRNAPIETEISIKTAPRGDGFYGNSAETLNKNRNSIKTARITPGPPQTTMFLANRKRQNEPAMTPRRNAANGKDQWRSVEISVPSVLGPAESRAGGRYGTRASGWQGVGAGHWRTRFRVPRRVFLYLDYATRNGILTIAIGEIRSLQTGF
jgi:hypothetical protein